MKKNTWYENQFFRPEYENCLQYDVMHDFTVWLRTGSNPADIDWFETHIGKTMYFFPVVIFDWRSYIKHK